MTDTAARPTFNRGRRSGGRTRTPAEGSTPSETSGPAKGAWIEVASGPAQGLRGRVVERVGASVTIMAMLLGQRPLLLTVDLARCSLLDSPPERW